MAGLTLLGAAPAGADAVLPSPARSCEDMCAYLGADGRMTIDRVKALVVEKLATVPKSVALAIRTATAHAALIDANRQLWAMAGGAESPRTMGSTIVALAADAAPRTEFPHRGVSLS